MILIYIPFYQTLTVSTLVGESKQLLFYYEKYVKLDKYSFRSRLKSLILLELMKFPNFKQKLAHIVNSSDDKKSPQSKIR